ncbi:MAG: hypothetical protein CME65_15785 [Halobacteriovoraceae bacterium]|nr:hypothetical protein [Halobacteriovoraceae bacterium]|tara:strand:- start:44722 stop:45627 length:906 start_codon:yes stop_codon:yes gene_type:complete
MKTLLITLSLQTLLLANAHAGLKTRILKVISPETSTDAFEVLVAKDRQIFTVNPSQAELLEELRRAEELNSVVELTGNEDNELLSLELIEEGDNVLDFYPSEGLHPMTNYTPSNIDGVDRATELFNELAEGSRWMSQCFNRAHLWSRQLDKEHGVKSMKILIYYTKRFRNEIGGKWWFHIAPMVDVNGEHYVLDKEFTRAPVTEENWEHIFTRKMEEKGIYGYRCKVIQNISEYYDDYNQNNEYCNIQITSMYYWEPNDMSRLERTGEQKTEYLNRELRIAAKNVYWRWRWKRAFNRVKVD